METKILSLDDVLMHLDAIQSLPPGLSDHFAKISRNKSYRKREMLLRPPAVCRHLYFIRRGLLRSFYVKDDGVEVTSGLYMEGDFVVAVYSFYAQTASVEFIEAIEDTEVYCISYAELQEIYMRFPEFRLNGLALTIRYLVHYSQQMQLIRAMSAPEKIRALQERYPNLLNRVPQKYLASYVDLIPETFSKIKNSMNH